MKTQRRFVVTEILIAIVLGLLVVGGVYFISKQQTKNALLQTVSDQQLTINNDLFLATFDRRNKILKVTVTNPTKGLLETKQIALVDYINTQVESTSQHSNNSVQFNPTTGDIFFHTIGKIQEMGGYVCGNKDGTCADRIYKINLHDNTPQILFELELEENVSLHWIINPVENSLLIGYNKSYTGQSKRILEKRSAVDGKIVFSVAQEIGPYFGSVIPPQGTYLYQIREKRINTAKVANVITYLEKISTEDGAMSTEKIHEGPWGTSEIRISPNGRYVAYYAHPYPLPTEGKDTYFYLYDSLSKSTKIIPYSRDPWNVNILWSGDSTKALLLLDGQTSYVDVVTGRVVKLTGLSGENAFVYTWASSSRYFLYSISTVNPELKIFDTQENKTVGSVVGSKSDGVLGYQWY